ncbi:Mitochondrial assembly of ribosomal large subunit protein 1 [Merluccius polli]|uniref:Mitochondrial assembly of ribosomal large subunit protein 1 n=1 Tax=Merluccius polli TaxID=89951 RepID=A0AA47MQV4_MERPO|nr:Mitochondrial assembly of ribosomal large subunit protein 1 [Merluccius polli]
MCGLNGCRRLLMSVITKDVAHGYLKIAKYASWTPRSRYDTTCRHRQFVTMNRCFKPWHLQSACRVVPKRHFSEMLSESKRRDEFQEKTEEEDGTSLTGPGSFNIDVMVSLLRQENAVDICVIKIPEAINYSDYFIVVSGISPRHLSAMAHYAIKVHKYMKKECEPHAKLEGKDAEEWKCIDFGSMVLHLMLPETREVYELEKLWSLRFFDEQLRSLPAETLPEDFIYGLEDSK